MDRASLREMGKRGSLSERILLRIQKLVPLVAFSVALSACQESGVSPVAEKASVKETAAPWNPEPAPDLCALKIAELESNERESPTPLFDQHRAEILARARSVPVIFHTRPGAPASATETVLRMRASLREAEDPAHAILEVLRKTRGNYPLRRQVFLSDHYLYAETPVLALRLSQVLRLDHLFAKTDKTVTIERGTETIEVTRQEGQYFLPPIPDVNPKKRHHQRLASLLLFDRVKAEGEDFGPPLHVDLRPLQRTLGFSSAAIHHVGNASLVADLSVYGAKSRAVFNWNGTEARLECETVQNASRGDFEKARFNYHLDQELIDPILQAAHQMIFRRLPFDEPKTEEGQQDGLLRLHFRQAYRHYANTYEFNGDSYYVFDGYGRPRVPQVCIDFITDAFDWGTGGHWPERGEKREYRKGALNFASMGMENARSVENLAEFASEHPEWFDVLYPPKEERIKFRHRTKFFEQLARDASLYRRGDIVFIYGLRDDGKFHYHSFLIDEKDPVTAMPTVVVANAGPPQARSWEGEMQNAPKRSIVARVRVRREILQKAHEQARTQPGVPLSFPNQEKEIAATAPPTGDDQKRQLPQERTESQVSTPDPTHVLPDNKRNPPHDSGRDRGDKSELFAREPRSGRKLRQNVASPTSEPGKLRKEPPQATDGAP